jgi:hypothetical protein
MHLVYLKQFCILFNAKDCPKLQTGRIVENKFVCVCPSHLAQAGTLLANIQLFVVATTYILVVANHHASFGLGWRNRFSSASSVTVETSARPDPLLWKQLRAAS